MASLASGADSGSVAISAAAPVGPTRERHASQDEPVFRSSSTLVLLYVTVTSDSRFVSDLPSEAFTILENGRPQPIAFFASDVTPATIGLLIDSSISMRVTRDAVIAAARGFAMASRPADELFGLVFNDRLTAVLPGSEPFTPNAEVLRDSLAEAFKPRGQTRLFDAIAAGVQYLDNGHTPRKILVVVSDGMDNASHLTAEQAIARTQAANVAVYTVAIVDPIERDRNPKILRRLAEATGGEAFAPRDRDRIAEAFTRIAADIRHTYTIGYIASTDNEGRRRTLHVGVDAPGYRKLRVRTRTAYPARAKGGQSGGDGVR